MDGNHLIVNEKRSKPRQFEKGGQTLIGESEGDNAISTIQIRPIHILIRAPQFDLVIARDDLNEGIDCERDDHNHLSLKAAASFAVRKAAINGVEL